MTSGGWRCIQASFRRNPTNHDKIPAKPAKEYRKIFEKSGPGGTPEPPESARDPSGTHQCEENAKRSKKVCSQNRRETFLGRFFGNFGSRPGAQNHPKTRPGPKKGVRRRRRKRFWSVFLAVAIWSRSPDRFSLDFSPKITPEWRELFHANT